MKQTKDCIDLWYMVKKPLKIKEIEKDLQQLVGNKLVWIAMKINQIMEVIGLEELDQLTFFSLEDIARALGKKQEIPVSCYNNECSKLAKFTHKDHYMKEGTW
jgi:hypothetical protein